MSLYLPAVGLCVVRWYALYDGSSGFLTWW